MNKKTFLLGVALGTIVGIIIAVAALFAYVAWENNSDDGFEYLERPLSYEDKEESSFKVIQIIAEDAALAVEEVKKRNIELFCGNVVVVIGENFYSDQVVTVRNPQRIGTYSYVTNNGIPKTVPVIEEGENVNKQKISNRK